MNNIDFDIIVQGINRRPSKGAFGFSTSVLLHDGDNHILFDTGSFGIREYIKELIGKNQITGLVISHLHFDHCANIDLFTKLPIFVSNTELESLNGSNDFNVYEPINYFKDKLHFITLNDQQKITDNIIAHHTPGHTAGHFSLAFLHDSKKYLAAGDSVKSAKEFLSDSYITKPADLLLQKQTKEYIKRNFDYIIPGHQNLFSVQNPKDTDIPLTYF